jgi:hypothetical protein
MDFEAVQIPPKSLPYARRGRILSPANEDTMVRILGYSVRFTVAVAALGLLSSIPAAGQAPKLSPQQLNPPVPKQFTLPAPMGSKPIATPRAPIVYIPPAPMGSKPIAAPRAPAASRTIALQPAVRSRGAKPGDADVRQPTAEDAAEAAAGAAIHSASCIGNPRLPAAESSCSLCGPWQPCTGGDTASPAWANAHSS